MTRQATSDRLIVRDAALPGRINVPEFIVEQGQCIVLCGPNGSGKSSLLRLLAGLERLPAGTIQLGDLDLCSQSRRVVASHIAWLPQRPYLGEVISCESIVAAARFRFLEAPDRALHEARRILGDQGIAHLAERPAQQVSGGELQRVLVASLIAQDVPFLLVDEPANHLDPRHQVSTYQKLGALWRNEGRTIVVVTHDVRLARLLGPPEKIRVIGVKDGEILPETDLASPDLREMLSALYGVDFVDPDLPGGLSVDLEAYSQRDES